MMVRIKCGQNTLLSIWMENTLLWSQRGRFCYPCRWRGNFALFAQTPHEILPWTLISVQKRIRLILYASHDTDTLWSRHRWGWFTHTSLPRQCHLRLCFICSHVSKCKHALSYILTPFCTQADRPDLIQVRGSDPGRHVILETDP